MSTSKFDTHTGVSSTWQAPHQYFITAPEFIPRPGGTEEDDGWVVAVAFNSDTLSSEVVLLDAGEVEKGPIAVLEVPSPLPHGVHGNWTDAYYGPQD
jgi:all-trans-8'-apo-beta-carotenal 15,15'-oxygenase